MMSYIYLASVYSLGAPANTEDGMALRELRYQQVLECAAEYTKLGEVIFSPIVHSHPMAVRYGLDGDFDFWAKIDYAFIANSSLVRVLMMPGWEQSKGITAEIKYARSINKEVQYANFCL